LATEKREENQGEKEKPEKKKREESWVLTRRFSHQGAIGILKSLGFNWVLSFFSF
jgi:hypothetical protein